MLRKSDLGFRNDQVGQQSGFHKGTARARWSPAEKVGFWDRTKPNHFERSCPEGGLSCSAPP